MSKLYDPPPQVDVQLDLQGLPTALYWRGTLYQGESLDHWRVQTEWWEQEVARDYYLWSSNELICVIFRDAQQQWHLQRIYD